MMKKHKKASGLFSFENKFLSARGIAHFFRFEVFGISQTKSAVEAISIPDNRG